MQIKFSVMVPTTNQYSYINAELIFTFSLYYLTEYWLYNKFTQNITFNIYLFYTRSDIEIIM